MTRDERAIVFVYGTLRAGGVRAIPALFPDARLIGTGTVRGRLRDFGAYPGLVLDPGRARCRRRGVRDLGQRPARHGRDRALRSGRRGSEVHLRRRVPVTLAAGGTLEAWVYECGARLRELGHPIPATDWIAHARAKGELPPEAWPDGAPIDGRARRCRAAGPPAGP